MFIRLKEAHAEILKTTKIHDEPVNIPPHETMVDEFNRGGKDLFFIRTPNHHNDRSEGDCNWAFCVWILSLNLHAADPSKSLPSMFS